MFRTVFRLTCFVVVFAQTAGGADVFRWSAGLRGRDLVVVFDTTVSPPNLVVESASIVATFRNSVGRLLDEPAILEVPVEEIRSGGKYTYAYDTPAGTSRVTVLPGLFKYYAEGYKNDGTEIPQTELLDPSVQIRVGPPPSIASRCDMYGRRARQQSLQNLALSCGESGNRWQSDPAFHANWCRTAPEREANAETMTRDTILRSCVRQRAQSTVVRP